MEDKYSAVFEALASQKRRQIIGQLCQKGVVEMDLENQIGLVHSDLPQLEESGSIQYNVQEGRIERGKNWCRIEEVVEGLDVVPTE